jgi:hypothetical protein
MRTRTKGILVADNGDREVDKWYRGERIFARLGKASQAEAEEWLRARQADCDTRREIELRGGDEQLFAAAARKYLVECQQRPVRTSCYPTSGICLFAMSAMSRLRRSRQTG